MTAPLITQRPSLIDPTNYSTGDRLTEAFNPVNSYGGYPGVKPWVFKIGGVYYAVLQSANPANLTTGAGGVWSSLDAKTWTLLDSSHGPVLGAGMTCFYPGAGSLIYVAYTSSVSGNILFNTFNVSSRLWGTPSAELAASSAFGPLRGGGFHVTVLSNGDLYVYFNETSPNTKAPAFFAKYSAGVWGAITLLTTNAVNIYDSILCVITDSSDRTHVIYEHDDTAVVGSVELDYVQVSPTGVAGALTTVLSVGFLGGQTVIAGNPQIIGNNLFVPMLAGIAGIATLTQCLVGAGLAAPTWTLETVDPGSSTCPAGCQVIEGDICSVAVAAAGVPQIFWAVTNVSGDAAPQQVWTAMRVGLGTWSAPVLVYDYSLNPPSGSTFYGGGLGSYISQLTAVAGSLLLIASMPFTGSAGLGSVAGVAFGFSPGGILTLTFKGMKIYG